MKTNDMWLARLGAKTLPTRKMLSDTIAWRLSLAANLVIIIPCLLVGWELAQLVPLTSDVDRASEMMFRVMFDGLIGALAYLGVQIVGCYIRHTMHLEGAVSHWLCEVALDIGGYTKEPDLHDMFFLEAQCRDFPELTQITGAWASQRKEGLLDDTDMRHLCRAGRRLAKNKDREEALQRKLNRKRLEEEARVQQREKIAQGMKTSGLGEIIEAHKQARALETATTVAEGASPPSRL